MTEHVLCLATFLLLDTKLTFWLKRSKTDMIKLSLYFKSHSEMCLEVVFSFVILYNITGHDSNMMTCCEVERPLTKSYIRVVLQSGYIICLIFDEE